MAPDTDGRVAVMGSVGSYAGTGGLKWPLVSDGCPNCGYCRHCGRSNDTWRKTWPYPAATWGVTPDAGNTLSPPDTVPTAHM